MADVGEFVATLRFKLDGDGLKQASVQMDNAQHSGSMLDSVMSHFVFTMGDVVSAGGKVYNALKSVADAAITDEYNMTMLSSAMKNQGVFTEKSIELNEQYAETLSQHSRYSKDELISLMAVTTQYGLHDQKLRDTTLAAVNMSTAFAAMGLTVEQAAKLLVKASEGNTTALSRYGIVVDSTMSKEEQYLALIKRFTTDSSAANDAMNTTAGKSLVLSHNFDILKENLGKGLLPAINLVVEGLNKITTAVIGSGHLDYEQKLLATMKDRLAAEEKDLGSAWRNQEYTKQSIADYKTKIALIEQEIAKLQSDEGANTHKSEAEIEKDKETAAKKSAIKEEQITKEQKYDADYLDYQMAIGEKTLDDKKKELAAELAAITGNTVDEKESRLKLLQEIFNINKQESADAEKTAADIEKTREKTDADEKKRLDKIIADHKKLLNDEEQFVSKTKAVTDGYSTYENTLINNDLQTKLNANTASYNDQVARANATITDSTELNTKLQTLAQTKADNDAKIQKDAQDKEIALKQAMKPIMIAETVANTAVAIMKIFADGGLFAIPAAIAAGVEGALEVATIEAQQFAGGVRNFSGGMAIVGERGPELVKLPAGSDVYTNQESRAMAGGTTIVINANGPANREFARQMGNEIMKQVNVNRKW
jgi:hypothetical protein